MNALRTITRTSNWTPDRLRVLSAIVVSADHVSDAPLGRVDGVVLDERSEIQSFIVTLWDRGLAGHAVLLPLTGVVWYTEGFAPALGIAWTPEVLRQQPVLARSSRPRRPSLIGAELAIVTADAVDVTRRRRTRGNMIVGLLGAAGTATLGALLLDPMLVASIALFLAPIAAALGTRPAPVAPAIAPPLSSEREPWVTDLEKHLLAPRTFERRVLHFSLLRPIAPAHAVHATLPLVGAMSAASLARPPVIVPIVGLFAAPRPISRTRWPAVRVTLSPEGT